MESYIIRIYRRDTLNPDSVSGLVEGSSLKKPVVFSSIREILDVLRKSTEADLASKKTGPPKYKDYDE